MSGRRSGEDQLWQAVWQLVRPFLLAAVPSFDLRAATECDD
ncbi:MAG: hypothetical protein ACRDPO_25540 [Streptosporangiaceae bacterium]